MRIFEDLLDLRPALEVNPIQVAPSALFLARSGFYKLCMTHMESQNTAFLLQECKKTVALLKKLGLQNLCCKCCENLNICALRKRKFWIKLALEDSRQLVPCLQHKFFNIGLLVGDLASLTSNTSPWT